MSLSGQFSLIIKGCWVNSSMFSALEDVAECNRGAQQHPDINYSQPLDLVWKY